MFCPNCGTQIPDGAQACMQCGTTIPAQAMPMQTQPAQTQPTQQDIFPQPAQTQSMQQDIFPQPAQTQPMQPQSPIPQPVQSQSIQPQPMQPNVGVQQSGFGSQPAFGSAQPSYIPPSNYAPVTPVKKSKTPIIIACCAAFVAIAAVVFFVFIFPNLNRGPLEHKWSVTESGVTMTYDLKNNTMTALGVSMPIEWKTEGDDRLSITMSFMGMSETQYFTYSLSSDGKTLTLTADEGGIPIDFKRDD